MADTYTKIADLIDPEVMGDMVSARIPKKLRVAPFAKVDDTLAGVPGDTITVPAYAYIGDADIVAEGEAVTIEKMTTSTRKATVKKAMKGIGLTDEAVLSGYGNPVGEANTQLAMAIAAKIAAKSPTMIRIAKEALTGIEDGNLEDKYRWEQGFTLQAYMSPDSAETRDAFVEKRDAKF